MQVLKFNHANVHQQLSPEQLVTATLNNNQGILNDTGALCINTGKFSGRSPDDKFIVDDELTSLNINWGGFNTKISKHHYQLLKAEVLNYLDNRIDIWYRKCYACAQPEYQLSLNVFNEYPSGNLFAYNMFLRPGDVEQDKVLSDWTIVQAPGFYADPVKHGTRSPNFSIISFADQTILIGGSGYTGEIKKSVFTVLNYILPANHHVLSMHCSANTGHNGDVALFFGLSGTGKTTLSTDPERKLIGDDEHGWNDEAVFNFEGGCYAKTIGLNEVSEPDIFAAIRAGALVENIVFKPGSNIIDFANNTLTENTRVSYPLNYIKNIAVPSIGNIPNTIFFLTCDASGVLPPVSKLNIAQAKYYFLSGYTSKIAGTEAGVTEPKPTFSACFGAPFLPLHPSVYADFLGKKLEQHKIQVWLVNTGWSGLPYREGKRISIKHTRAIISAALNGSLITQEFENFPIFNLAIPTTCPGVPQEILNPFNNEPGSKTFEHRVYDLAKRFDANFKQYENIVCQSILEGKPTFS